MRGANSVSLIDWDKNRVMRADRGTEMKRNRLRRVFLRFWLEVRVVISARRVRVRVLSL